MKKTPSRWYSPAYWPLRFGYDKKGKGLSFLLAPLAVCSGAQAADVISSLGAKPGSGLIETNPFARHADGSFWLYHGIITKLIILAFYLVFSASLYWAVRRQSRVAAQVAASIPMLYWAFEAMGAVIDNLLLASGLGRW